LRKTLLVGIPVLALALLVAIVLPPRLAHGSPIATKAVGVWQETDSPEAYKLSMASDPGQASGVWYTVTYPRSFKVPFPASLKGDTITIWGENTTMSAPVWRVTYDKAADTLTVTRPNGAEVHTLKRVLDGGARAPQWLFKQARGMARHGKATQAWWTKTTLELALRAVEPGHRQQPSATNSRPTYLLVMRGAFTPWSYPLEPGPEPVACGFWVIDLRTHLVDEAGGTNSPPDTEGLDLHEIDIKSLVGM
jgi:hypothetical protein